MPENPGEIIIEGSENDYYLRDDSIEELLGKEFYTEEYDESGERRTENPLKIVGLLLRAIGITAAAINFMSEMKSWKSSGLTSL